MTVGRLTSCVSVFLTTTILTGCASLEELRQVQMSNRNLVAEKAQL